MTTSTSPVEPAPAQTAEEKRARLAERLRQASRRENQSPLSFAQQRLWFLDQLHPNSPLYNVPSVLRLTGSLDVIALDQSLRNIIKRHETLRTRFVCSAETPVQVISNQFDFALRVVDMPNAAEADKWIREEVRRPFNLASTESLLRASLVRLASNDHMLVLNLHHIASDEWSLNVLFRELEEFYKAQIENRKAQLPELPIQYSDYADWQKQKLSGESVQDQLQYWKTQLAGSPPITELMTDKPRERTPAFRGRTVTRRLSPDLGPRLKQLSAERQSSLFMVLMAAFQALVHRYTSLEDVVVGTPVSGRNSLETEGLIGFFVNTLLLRANLAGNPTFDELLQRVRAAALGAYAHQDLPFERVVESLRPERSLAHLAFTRLMFALQAKTVNNGAMTLPGLQVEHVETDTGTAKFDLTFVVQDFGSSMVALVEYDCDLFEQGTMERLLEHYENLLRSVVIEPVRRLSDLPILGEAERRRVLVEWNDNATDYPRQQCIHELFEAQARATPAAVALVFGRETMTYGELNESANRLARVIARQKFDPAAPIAICMERSPSMIIGLLAILKAGGAYVPMDTRYPKERLAFMLSDTRTGVLLTQQSLLRHLPHRGLRAICLDADADEIQRESAENLPNRTKPTDTAYIIYTSGSTGQPKGVAVPHLGVNRLVFKTNYIQLDATDRIAQVSNMSFDAATFEIWGSLLNGGQLRGIATDIALSPKDFAAELREQGITAMFLTSALFSQVASEVPGAFATMRTVMAGGEALDARWVRAVLKDRPPHRLVNGYGPTENTTFTCCALLRDIPENATNVPIGKPLSNTQVYILDANRNPVPIGVPGELYTGGDGLAKGYWNRPELTAEKFVLHQFSADSPCVCLYRTGDLARWLPDGNVEYLGRIDNQVKLRGYRIELGEIEAVMGRCPGVRECAVKVCGSGAGQTRLVAYYVPDGKLAPKPNQLRAILGEHLPEYMIPSAFVQIESLPLTHNGKVDRRALPEPDHARPTLTRKYASPRDAVELELCRIWESVLGVEPVGIEDNFFDLGGHSLLAVKVSARIEKAFGKKLPLAAIFTAATVEKLAVVVRDEIRDESATAGTSVVELQPKGTQPPLFLVHGAGGGMFWGYVNLARRLGADQPVYGLSSRGLNGHQEFDTMEEMAAQYVKDMRRIQPHGPYYLGGYCFGGNVAFEMARQIEAQGEKVALLALLNCAPPNSSYTQFSYTPAWGLRFAKNLVYWADYCRQWTPAQRHDFILWKTRRVKQKLSRLLGGGGNGSAANDAENLVDLATIPADQRALWQSHILALRKFHPKPYEGRVHLFRSPGHPLWCSFEQDYGWGDFARRGVNITIVQGAHEKVLEEPWVDETAAELKKVLEQSRELDMDFWKRELAGAPALLELPTDRTRPAVLSKAVATETRPLPRSLASKMETGDRAALALAALDVVLNRYSGQDDLPVGLQTGSDHKANIAVVRTRMAAEMTGRDLLDRVRTAKTAAVQHSQIPFKDVIAQICPSADSSYHPIAQVFFATEAPSIVEGYDLRFCLLDNELGPVFRLEYATDLFNRATAQRMLGHVETALQSLVAAPEQPLSKLSILTPAESETILNEWNRTQLEYPREKTLAQLFNEQAARTPTAEALVVGTKRFTYRELYERAATIAKSLQALGVGNQSLVGICLERSEDMVAGILGTLQAGGAYVPLDPTYPKARLAAIAQDAGLRVLLTRERFRELIPASKTQVLLVENIQPISDKTAPLNQAGPNDLAYVLYTSGSTGQPKGVALENRNAVAMVCWAKDAFLPEEYAGMLASTSMCFDLSVYEMFVPLCWGGKIILADNALALPGLPAASEVTLVNTVPSAMRELLRINGVPSSVKVVNLAGEPLATALVEQIYSKTSAKKVYDLYGPTETTTYSTGALRKTGEPATIGRPLANEQVYILDKQMQPLPVGMTGDLYIGGDKVARGYLNRPDLTAERFLPHPYKQGSRIYKTGDVARWREDGNLTYLGRSDHQVKIRGFRIELGEIEIALKANPAVAEVVVIAREDRPGEKYLAAYVVFNAGKTASVDDLRRCTRERLPEFMTPAQFVFLPKLPLTPNGKVDRRALPAPQAGQSEARTGLIAPRTDAEKKVAAAWSEVLGIKDIGATDHFFELGGHSLTAIQVISRLRESLGIELPLSCLFDAPTVEALAAGVDSGRWNHSNAPVPALEPISREGVLPASFMQDQLWFLNQLEPKSDAYNVPTAIRIKCALDVAALQKSLDLIIDRHEALRTTLHFVDGVLSEKIAPSLSVQVWVTEIPGADESKLAGVLQAEAHRSFDLERGPLIRARLARMSATDHALLIVMHHAVSDGWSLDVFFRELETSYRAIVSGNSAPNFAPLPVQYADFAQWQRRWLQGATEQRELAYWRQKLAGAPVAVELPTDSDNAEQTEAKVGRIAVELPQALSAEIVKLSQREGGTPFMVLMAALAITLHKWTGQTDMVLGTVVAGRNRREIEGLIGCFMNFLPLRFKISGAAAGFETLRAVKAEIIESQSHQDCPFEKIVESAKVERRPGCNPLYNVALLYQNTPDLPQFGEGITSAPIVVNTEAALLDLRFEANEMPAGLALTCEYKAGLFHQKSIEQLLASFQSVLQMLAEAPRTVIADVELKAPKRAQPETIAICGTFTAEPIEEPLRFWLDELEISARIKFAPYDQVFQQLLDSQSDLATNRNGLNVLLIRLNDWESNTGASGALTFGQAIKHHADEFVSAVQSAAARGGASMLVCFCPPSRMALAEPAKAEALKDLETALTVTLHGIDGVHVVTSAELSQKYPVADYDDPAGDELGRIPYTPLFFTSLATMLARKFHALRRPPCKVIALDCDNTLWSGVCGEDGPNGIRLEAGRVALQNFVLRQREAGKLLVICSKNDEADVEAVFAKGPAMPILREHISAWRVNWKSKSENIKSIAQELKLGLDSFVLIDDNPVECAEVEGNSPEVLALQLPEDVSAIPQFLDHCWAFDQLKTTAEDKGRAAMYQQNQLREQLQSQSTNFADFIAKLELQVDIAPAAPAQLARVSQLTQRTNQFNVNGKRRTESEVKQLAGVSEIWTVSVKDRFGDYGLVGAMIFSFSGQALVVDSFLLSCRALGRGVEHRMLQALGKAAAQHHSKWVNVPFERLPRNKPALDFLESIGTQFQQGGQYQFPPEFAAKVEFTPRSESPVAPASTEGKSTPAPGAVKKFTKCRAIAAELNDAAKIHQKIEARLALRPGAGGRYVAPQSQIERELCELWQKLLRVERVGTADDFFELGGHSLLAVRLFAQVEKMTGQKLPLVTLFQAPTIGQLAAVLSKAKSAVSHSVVIPIQPNGSKPPLFLVHGAGGDVLWGYANLLVHMDRDQPIFALRSRGQIGLEEFDTIEEMAAYYVQAIRAQQPEGPYYIGGYCFGGNVAYEMGRQLQAEGAQVALMALLDAAPVNVGYESVEWWKPQFFFLFARNTYYWLEDFKQVPARDRWRFVGRKIRSIGRKIAKRIKRKQGEAPVDLEEIIDPALFPENELKLWRKHLQALHRHVQQPCTGNLALFRTRGHPMLCSFAHDLSWGKLTTGEVSVRLIPGSHENIFMEPNVKTLAADLTAALKETQKTTTAENQPALLST